MTTLAAKEAPDAKAAAGGRPSPGPAERAVQPNAPGTTARALALTVGATDDPVEREADRIAARLLRHPAPSGDRKSEGRALAPPIVNNVLASPGKPLDERTRAYFEPRLEASLASVRVHDDAAAAESARAVGAAAYAVGGDIVFSAGSHRPGTPSGDALIAHELAHVVQSGAGARHAVRRQSPAGTHALDPDVLLENASPFLARAVGSTELWGFATGSTAVPDAMRGDLLRTAHDIVVLLRQYPASTVRVIGHTDTVGTEESNMTLGTARAEAVNNVLVAQGVLADAITVESRGEGPPLAVPTRDNAPNARNRRVEVRFEPFTRHLGVLPGTLEPPQPTPAPPPQLTPPQPLEPIIPPPFEEALAGFIQTENMPENARVHIALDLSTGVTPNVPGTVDPGTVTVAAVLRNQNFHAGDRDARIATDWGHEFTGSVTFSRDTPNAQVFQAAIAIFNVHFRRAGDDLVEVSVSPTVALAMPGRSVTGGVQAQIEFHLTSRFSITAAAALGLGAHDPSAPPDRGSLPLGTLGSVDFTFAPASVSALVHF